MKKIILSVSLLSGVAAMAQQKDTVNRPKSLDEVIINTYVKKDSEYTNKMPLKAIENPQVYSSIDKTILENQLIFNVDDAFRNITGLQKMWGATNRAGDGGAFVTLRGFTSNNSLRNGLVAPVTTSIDAINIEKVEVLKGPSATLYGSNATSYGGVVNRVTKRPHENFGGNVSLSGGSYNFYRAQADVNAPLTNDKKLLFRINTAYTTEGTFQKKDANNTFFAFAPALTYRVNEKLDINLEYEMFHTRAMPEQVFFYLKKNPQYPGDPYTNVDNMKDLEKLGLDYKQSYLGDDLYTTAKVRNLFGQVNYQINKNIRSSTNINSSYSNSDGFNPYFSISPKANFTLNPADTELVVARADQSTDNSKKTYFQVQQNFNFDYSFGNMRNRTVAGFDFMKIKDRQHFVFLNGPFDYVALSGGDYSGMNEQTLSEAYATRPSAEYLSIGDQNVYSGYISNVFTPISGLNIMTSLRYENNDAKDGKVGTNDVKAYSQSAWSPKFGIVYEIIKDKVSVFGNYQNSFKSNGYYLTDMAGNSALSDPERANQFEGGFKANLVNGRINATVSYYNIDVKNTLLTVGYLGAQAVQTQAGGLTSKGVEVEVNAYLVKGFSLIGGFSYNDSKFTHMDTANENRIGLRPDTAGSPWLANFNASYQFLNGNLRGLGFGVGGNYASDNKVVNTPSGYFVLPKYFVLNASAFYDAKKFRIGVKVDNFTNQHYWTGYTTANPQKLINAVGSVTYKF